MHAAAAATAQISGSH